MVDLSIVVLVYRVIPPFLLLKSGFYAQFTIVSKTIDMVYTTLHLYLEIRAIL
jgi:hypothetical protein